MTSESILGTGKDSPRETREGSSRSNAVVAKSKDREFEEEGHTESVEFQILDNGDKGCYGEKMTSVTYRETLVILYINSPRLPRVCVGQIQQLFQR